MHYPLLVRLESSKGNLGDILIWKGLVHLIQKYDSEATFTLIDKFSEKSLRANFPVVKDCGFMIFAGTPQYNCLDDWSFWWDTDLWTRYIVPHNLRVFSIAGGSGSVDPCETLESFTNRCMSSVKTYDNLKVRKLFNPTLSVRDQHAHHLLQALCIDHRLLPCTAGWSLMGIPQTNEFVCLSLPGVEHYYEQSHKPSFKQLLDNFKQVYRLAKQAGLQPVFSSPGREEGDKISPLLEGFEHFIPETFNEWQNFLSRCVGSIGCRIHTAIPMAGQGKRSVLLPTDSRHTAVGLYGISIVDLFSQPEDIFSAWTSAKQPIELIDVEAQYFELFNHIKVFQHGNRTISY